MLTFSLRIINSLYELNQIKVSTVSFERDFKFSSAFKSEEILKQYEKLQHKLVKTEGKSKAGKH